MSIQFNVIYDSTIAPYAALQPLLTSNMLAAANRWGEYFTSNASIEILIQISDLNGSGRAGGMSLSLAPYGTAGPLEVLRWSMAHEIATGTDVNGDTAEARVNIAPGYLLNELWFDPTPLDRSTPGPAGKTDAISVFAHELGHALGFNGYLNWATYLLPSGLTFETVFDSFVTKVGNVPYFNGPNAMAAYGGPVPLTVGNLFHVGNSAPNPGSGLVPDMMNGVVYSRGTIYDISKLDIAFMKDLGLPVNDYVGFRSADLIIGDGADNLLKGLEGNDTLDGGAGNDTLEGGPGADQYFVDSPDDVATDPASGGIDLVKAALGNGQVFTLGANLENLTLLGSAHSGATGNALANVLTGNGGNNTLDGGAGKDVMAGGPGNDTYVVDMAGETVTEAANAGIDTVHASIGFTLGATLENLVLYGSQHVNGSGNAAANSLTGNDGNNVLNGLGGFDAYVGSAGNDTYSITEAGDTLSGADAGTDTVLVALAASAFLNISGMPDLENVTFTGVVAAIIIGNGADNALIGGAGKDSLVGGEGHDTLNGSAGADTLVGGNGNDTYVVDSALDVVDESGTDGVDTIVTSASFTLGALSPIENVTLSGTAALNATGNAFANLLTGNAGANILNGAGGADTMAGGAGADTYVVDDALDVITETMAGAAGGIDLVQTAVDFSLAGTQIENAMLTSGAGDSLIGNELANRLTGSGNNDTLDGGAGKDVMAGGLGNDTYRVDMAGETVTEALNAGTDSVEAAVSYTLGANLENLVLVPGAGNLNGSGNALANSLAGNDGNNVLNGLGGADLYIGSEGNDTYSVSEAGDTIGGADPGVDTVLVALAASAFLNISSMPELENVSFRGTAAAIITGNAGNNALTGGAGRDSLVGNDGNDTLIGGAGADTIVGGEGNDTYYIENNGDILIEDGASDGDTVVVFSGNVFPLVNIEHYVLMGTAINASGGGGANSMTGNAGNNSLAGGAGNDTLVGNAGNDTLDGGAGADALHGGDGNDLYIVDDAGDTTTETNSLPGGGVGDMVQAYVPWTLGSLVENLTLMGSIVEGRGNASANSLSGNGSGNLLEGMDGNDTLLGNAGNDTLDGGAGNDSMAGGDGNDWYFVGSAADRVSETSSLPAGGTIDTVESSINYTLGANLENLVLAIGAGALNGTGNALANALSGNTGNNQLSGLAGNDTLTGGAGADRFVFGAALNAQTNVDTIADFAPASDKLVLKDDFFAGIGPVGALDANAFGAFGAADATDRILYHAASGNLYFDADGSGVKASILFATLTGNPVLAAGDFEVIA